MRSPKVSWIKSPVSIKGQDPLGTKYPCEDVYSKLLPGIMNVTNRCRYYSFYPWVIWAFEQHAGKLKDKPLYEIIRRADCLFTLIALCHHRAMSSEADDLLHGELTGSRKLSAVMDEISLTEEHNRPKLAGLDYTLIPVNNRGGVFHPKILLLVGKENGLLCVGSKY